MKTSFQDLYWRKRLQVSSAVKRKEMNILSVRAGVGSSSSLTATDSMLTALLCFVVELQVLYS